MSRLKQKQSQRQSLSPQQIIQANLLQLNISALENRILDELESNPVLDQSLDNEDEETLSEQQEVDYEDDPDEYEPANIYDNKNKEDFDIPIAEQIDFIEGLVNQLIGLNLKEWEQAIAEEILWNLDQNGYLRVEPILIADRFNESENAVKQILNKVQKLDPAGIAALNLQDCLMIQLRGKEQTIAYQIISEYFDDFANHRYDNLQKKLDIDKDILGEIIKEIRTLNPRPGEGKIGIASEIVTPDILAVQRDSSWKVIINDSVNFWPGHLCEGENYWDNIYVDNKYNYGESFTDLGNGVYDLGEEFTDKNKNGKWDANEKFLDLGNFHL